MPNYNTQGITSSAGSDPRNLGGSEGYGNPTASTSSGIMSSTANPTANDDNKDEPGFFESIAKLFSGAGADLPSDKSDDDGDSGISFYDSPMFAPYDGGSDNDTTPQGGLPFETTAADRALYEALGVDVPEVYKGKMPEEEPEPNFDMDVLQKALQPEPITVEEIEVKAGDTLTAIAEEKGLPVQAVIDANPQIKNPDLIRPGEKVTLPGMISDMGKLLKTATDPEAPAPVSEDPDREFYQSGVPIEERVFEGADPRNLGGAEGYGSVGTTADAETGEGLMTRPKARPEGLDTPIVRSNRDPVKVAVSTDTTASNIKSVQQALSDMGYKPNGVDGAIGGGTKRALRKFQSANDLPITGELTQEVADLLTNGTSVVYPDWPVPSAEVEDILTDFNLSVFENEVGKIESGNKYDIKGGSGDHYDGRYQMGAAAKKDAARALGITLGHDAASREAFRKDSELQDRAFKAYTEKNHKHLTINSEKYRNMTAAEKLGILGYAHNQGATAAEEYLFTGQVGTDAFGTKGTKYTDAIKKALGN